MKFLETTHYVFGCIEINLQEVIGLYLKKSTRVTEKLLQKTPIDAIFATLSTKAKLDDADADSDIAELSYF